MSAQEFLTRAVEYDIAGRRLEAFKLYQHGISELREVYKSESDDRRKSHFLLKLKEYMDRAEEIKAKIDEFNSQGEVLNRFHVVENSTGYSYSTIFGKYLDEKVEEVQIDEPYLRENYQLQNFVILLELIARKCINLKYIKIVTRKDPKTETEQHSAFSSLVSSLKNFNITMEIEFNETLHDRQIILSSGYIVKIGRGLHFFKRINGRFVLGSNDYFFRPCMETNIDIYRCSVKQ